MNSRIGKAVIVVCSLIWRLSIHAQSDTLIYTAASPNQGFNFPYYIFIPSGANALFETIFMVEPNNTGVANDTFSVHDAASRTQAEGGPLGNYFSRKLNIPLLVPVFPRPQKQWKVYTHMLDRDVMRIKKGSLKRIDLQLLAMINDAREKMFELGFRTNQKIMMCGYSSSGVFCNRFAALHPEMVIAYSAGGINGLVMLPERTKHNKKLDYPIGINDFNKITRDSFNLAAFRQVKQFLYMGQEDLNDAVLFPDGYNSKERKIIFDVFGKQMLPDRWNASQDYYKAAGLNAEFHTYPGIGHGINQEVLQDVVRFYLKSIK